MPVSTSYPGVYVTEVASGVHTITGVATSITAFIGRAARGPADTPVTINSYSDFERMFGGLWLQSSMGYAVRDFYRNGGSRAIVVRLFHNNAPDVAGQPPGSGTLAARKLAMDTAKEVAGPTPALAADAAQAKTETYSAPNQKDQKALSQKVATAAKDAATKGETLAEVQAAAVQAALGATALDYATLSIEGWVLTAQAPGAWGNGLRARVKQVQITDPSTGIKHDGFNLMVRDGSTGNVETFLNVSIETDSRRRVDLVLASDSALVKAAGVPATIPADSHDPDNARGQFDPWADNFVAKTDTLPQLEATNVKVEADGLASDGGALHVNDFTGNDKRVAKRGLYALDNADLFNLLCIPPYLDGVSPNDGDIDYGTLVPDAVAYCLARRAVLLVDPPSEWKTAAKVVDDMKIQRVGTTSNYSALYFPRLMVPDPLRDNRPGELVPSGAMAGIMARTDSSRGVWKAPAGLEATVNGVQQLTVPLTDAENGNLNPLGVNCLRTFPAAGTVAWGARTLAGNDQLASEWKYLPVRRTALFIEESLFRGTQWVVFEPNDEPLWAQVRLNVGAFMHDLFRQGAFQGSTPKDAYFVKCDAETTTQNDINAGVVNILVGFAPLKPAEFVIISLQQIAGAVQA